MAAAAYAVKAPAGGQVLLLLLVQVLLACLLVGSAGQGLDVSSDRLGASVRLQEVSKEYRQAIGRAAELQKRWASKAKPCQGAGASASLCGADTSSYAGKSAALLATSPAVYDVRNVSHTPDGLFQGPTPMEQGDCNACVAYAIGAAAQSAAATARRESTSDVPFPSARQLFFCAAGQDVANDCNYGARLSPALQQLSSKRAFPDGLLAHTCLPMVSTNRLNLLAQDDLCKPLDQCSAQFPKGRFAYTRLANLIDIPQIQRHIRHHGASAVTRMTLPAGFKQWFEVPANRRAVYDNPKASNELVTAGGAAVNHAVVIAGYDNVRECWLIWSSWGAQWGEEGFARVKYNQLGIGDPMFTYGVMFVPDNPVAVPPWQDRVPDKQLGRGCYWYQVQPGDYVSRVADRLELELEELLLPNAGRIPQLGEYLPTGQTLLVCGIMTDEQCGAFENCYECEEVAGCTWCFEGDLKDLKPRCLSSRNKVCSREVRSTSECPVDNVKALEKLNGTDDQKLKSNLSCASMGNCRECLRFTYQCRWCLDAATMDLVHCQPGTQQCNSWYGQGPKECPLSGDAAAFNSWAGCKALDTCDRCLMYGGKQPQCVWCVASGKCVGAQTADAKSSQCSKKLTRGPKVCPKSATNTTKP
ncbi:hypothetical protein COO60DRAFT_1524168 [Scenedesmus sp. NREL 46B-D3]|nr:hypothetical protein COO60DRAFT_1524168 [Scenedesmus sp. NREL 46B-D3]